MSARPVRIVEEGRPATAMHAHASGFDLQDALLVIGFLLMEAFLWVVWRPGTLLFPALFCFGCACLIDRVRAVKAKERKHGST